MSYRLYVTRRKNWSDSDGPVITHTEWMSYIQMDKSLRLDVELSRDSDPVVAAREKEPTHAVWKETDDKSDPTIGGVFWLDDGNIMSDDPKLAARIKLFLIADGLQATLQGQKGEIYGPFGEPEKGRRKLRDSGRRRRWWHLW